MFPILVLLCLFWCRLICVISEETSEMRSLSVMEGNSVLLHTDVGEIHKQDDILWKYGTEKTVIAKINRAAGIFSTYDGPDGRFRDRLKLDNKTGSLTITNITAAHAGLYEVEKIMNKLSSEIYNVSVFGLPVPVIIRDSSQCSSSCSVVCSVEKVHHVTLSWLKGNSVLSSISVSNITKNLVLPLEVEYEDINKYICVVNNSIIHQNTQLDISELCHTKVSCCNSTVGVIRLIASAVVGVATVAVVVYDVRSTRA